MLSIATKTQLGLGLGLFVSGTEPLVIMALENLSNGYRSTKCFLFNPYDFDTESKWYACWKAVWTHQTDFWKMFGPKGIEAEKGLDYFWPIVLWSPRGGDSKGDHNVHKGLLGSWSLLSENPKLPHYSLVYYHIPSVASRLLSRSDRFRGDRGSFGSQHLPLGNDGDGLTGGWGLAGHGCFWGLKVPTRLLSGPKADMQCEKTCLKWFDLVWRSRFCWPWPLSWAYLHDRAGESFYGYGYDLAPLQLRSHRNLSDLTGGRLYHLSWVMFFHIVIVS